MSLIDHWYDGAQLFTALYSISTEAEQAALLADMPNMGLSLVKGIADAYQLTTSEQLSFEQAMERVGEQNTLEREQRKAAHRRFFEYLQTGQFSAIGFEPPRRIDSQPVLIPPRLMWSKINWKNSSLKNGALEIVDIRIVKNLIQIAPPERPNRQGKKSRRTFYFECFLALKETGKINPENSQKAFFADARAWLTENYPETFPTLNVGSDKTMYRYYKEFRDTLKD